MAEYRGQSVNWQFFKLLKFVLEFVQYEAAKIVTGAMKGTSRHSLMQEIGWEDMKTRRSIHKLTFYFKIINNLTPNYLKELLPSQVFERTHYFLRSYPDFTLFPVRTERFKKSFFPSSTMLWNDIDTSVRNLDSVILFKKVLCFVFLMFHSKICYLTFLSIDILPSFIYFLPLIIIYLKLSVNHLLNVFVALKLKVLIITFYIVRCLLLQDRNCSPGGTGGTQ